MTAAVQGRRLVIAGGAAGIGLATARLALAGGAQVAVIDRHAAPGDLPGFVADIRQSAAVCDAMAGAAAALGGIDGLVYCAGIDLQSSFADTTDESWERVIDVNLTGAMRACRAGLAHFAGTAGSIVLVSSAAGLSPLRHRTAYCASKAGLNMLAKAMAIELASRGIRVNALCPGAVETGLFRSGLADGPDTDAALAQVRARYVLERIAGPEEIAQAILFLLSTDASYVTGIAMAVDGGRTFH